MKALIKKINDFLRRFPAIRGAIILVIRYAQYAAASVKRILRKTPDGILTTGRRLTPEGENCYFGYYDKTPYSADGKRFIYHSIPAMAAPVAGQEAILYEQNLITDVRREIGRTRAWNLQQGAMLRYYTDDVIAWNDYRDGAYCTVFHNRHTDEERILSCPLYDIDRSGKLGLTLEFERLNVDAEGYGYIQQGIRNFDTPATISVVDIARDEQRVIISSDQLNQQYPVRHEGVTFFYFNHLNFNPSGSRFLFIQRYVYERQRYSRLFSAAVDGSDVRLLADEQMVSHFTWYSDEEILVYLRHEGHDAYYRLRDEAGFAFCELEDAHLRVDGHPTYSDTDRSLFVSDTYPDAARRRHLFTYNTKAKTYKELASLKAPIRYDGPVRCDFHPRFKPGCQSVCIDSIHEGFRGMYEIDL